MQLHIISIIVVSISGLSAVAQQGTTSLVSVTSTGAQTDSYSSAPGISADGRFVAFSSAAGNLVAGDTNGVPDIFVHDTQTGATTRVSVDSSGLEGNLESAAIISVAISADGRFIAFHSAASNLVASDSNGLQDVFVHDQTTGITERVSVSSVGVEGNSNSYNASISANGRFVAFSSYSTNLVLGDNNGTWDVFVRDRALSNTYRVSLDSNGTEGSADSLFAAVSADGRFVAFQSNSWLVPIDVNGKWDIYVYDSVGGTVALASVSTSGAIANGHCEFPAISADGRFVAFNGGASNLVAVDTNNETDVFVHDVVLGLTSRVSVSSLGAQGMGQSRVASISADGRCVTFESGAANLVAGDTNGVNGKDTFIHDRFTHTTMRTNVDSSGAQMLVGLSQTTAVSADGLRVVFSSNSANLVPNDTNGTSDIFLREIFCGPPANYCESGLSTNFCSPTMSASGTASASSSSGFTLTCTGLEAQKTGLILYGANGRLAQPWGPLGGSLLCVAQPVQRTPSSNSGGTPNFCDGSISIDWLTFVATHPNSLGQPLTPGSIIDAQCWYRDPPSPKGTNLSNGIEFELCP